MNCNEFKDVLDPLIDSELEPGDREAAEEHLGVCPECARFREVALRVKRIVREQAGRLVPSSSLRSRLMERLQPEAGSPSAVAPAKRTSDPKFRFSSVGNLAAAAALVVATLSLLLMEPAPKLDHHAAAEEVRDAYGRAGTGQIVDEDALRAFVEARLGVKYRRIEVPDSTLVSWRPELVAGHEAVRLDYEPDPGLGVNKLGAGVPLVSIFLLPLSSTAFSQSYLKDLQDGHYCTSCVHYEDSGTIYCRRNGDLFVAAVSNIGSQSFDGMRVR